MKQERTKRPNVLWIMSDQHNANCTGYAGHPNVKTPNLDRIASRGVNFTNAFANNPICAPSRISFITGQYCHTHRMFSNDYREYPISNPDTLACLFRRYGYQTAITGKGHMVPRWDKEGFEFIRYTDLIDSSLMNPTTGHYFKYLDDLGFADYYEEGTAKKGQEYTLDGSAPAQLPYEHSIEHFTGNESIKFLESRDQQRPFFLLMSFQRPHAPIAPAREHFNMYNPEDIVLPDNAFDYFENRFAGKPDIIRKRVEDRCNYPLADPDPKRLKRCLASYYALITMIDSEIGRVLKKLEMDSELENTIVLYTADHGDFSGEHGLFHKNLGIYDSIHRIPFLLSWPDGPQGQVCDELIESVDWYPTLCSLCNIPVPPGREGINLLSIAGEEVEEKDAVFCEWGSVSAIRTPDFRLVFYAQTGEGELYDHRKDLGETNNLWSEENYAIEKTQLLCRLLAFTMGYEKIGSPKTDIEYAPTRLVHFGRRYWSQLKKAYTDETTWPPADKKL